jgi:hypothetical protein
VVSGRDINDTGLHAVVFASVGWVFGFPDLQIVNVFCSSDWVGPGLLVYLLRI